MLAQRPRAQASQSKNPIKDSFIFSQGIHDKDIVAILHLLVSLARHFECPRKLPGGVTINMVVVQKKGGILLPMKVVEEITAATEGEEWVFVQCKFT